MKNPFNLILLAASSIAFESLAVDWSQWRGPNADGISPETDWTANWPAGGPEVKWRASLGTGFSSMTVSDGRVYSAGNENNTDTVYCLSADNGEVIWKYSYPAPLDPKLYEGGPNATPTIDDGKAYMFSRKGFVVALDAVKGTVIWSRQLAEEEGIKVPDWGFSGSVLVDGPRLILTASSGGIALDKATGKTLWKQGGEGTAYATPLMCELEGRKTVLIFSGSELQARNPETGAEFWSYPWKTSYDVNAADPVLVGNDRIFISSGYNHGCALLEVKNGKATRLWENKNMRNQLNSSVVHEGYVYGVDDTRLRCLDLANGEVKWTESSSGKGSLIMADGKLIVLSEKGELMVAEASPEGFNPISRAQVLGGKCWTAPALANGFIYARNAKGDLVCLDVRAK